MRLAWVGTVAVVAVSAAPALQFRNWQWIALALTVAVVLPGLRAARDRHRSHVLAPAGATTCGRDRSPAGRAVVRARFGSTRSVDDARSVEGSARGRDRGSSRTGVAAAGTAAGAVTALAWSVTVLLDGAGAAGFVQAVGAPVLALDAAAVLGALLLLPRDDRPRDDQPGPERPAVERPGTDRPGTDRCAVERPGTDRSAVERLGTDRLAARLGALVVATAVAALGFRLGAGEGAGAAAAAAAVLIAGCPCAFLLLPAPAPGPRPLLLRAEHGAGVLRAAAALHAPPDPPTPGNERHSRPERVDGSAVRCGGDPPPRAADPVGQALLAAARRRHPALPGVSDADGDPATGLRGVVSELTGDVVLAHAVLAGPPDWLGAHDVHPTPDALRAADRGAQVWCVAWDGQARGWLELVDASRPGAWRRWVATAVTVTAAGLGAGGAAVGALSPATAGAVPLGAALLVVALRMLPAPDRAGRDHPIGATAG